jgi:2-haloacid dehalogenase
MKSFRPKFITFDLYGTLTWFQMSNMTRELYAEHVPAERMEAFVADFAAYRFDEVLGAWKPYETVIKSAFERTCRRWNIACDDSVAQAFYDAVPSWGPHVDVSEPLARVGSRYPLVILSNACDDQIQSNVDKLAAPVHAVFTAEQAQAYKPRFQAFEYMFDQLGCGPEDVLHVSASLRYDLMSAWGLGIENKVYVNRGYEPSTPYYGYSEITDIAGLPGLVGL